MCVQNKSKSYFYGIEFFRVTYISTSTQIINRITEKYLKPLEQGYGTH